MRSVLSAVAVCVLPIVSAKAKPSAADMNFRADLRGTSMAPFTPEKNVDRLLGLSVDASEGIALDPLANKTWDLSYPKDVPDLSPPAPPTTFSRKVR